MSDAIVLLAISQVVCLGGMAYLYLQFQTVTRQGGRPRHANATFVERPALRQEMQPVAVAAAAATRAYAAPRLEGPARAAVETAIDGQVNLTTLARRMNKSEEEVRLLLRRQAAHR
jgi:hypothetical protein